MRYRHLALVVLALAACRADKARNEVSVSKALPFLPIPPEAEVVSRNAGPNAMQITFRSKQSDEYVANYYRTLLVRGGWSLESDTKDSDGVVAMYLVKDKHPMWIRIYRAVGAPGSMIEISGAVTAPDSVGRGAGPPGAAPTAGS